MTRAEVRRRLAIAWWGQFALTLAPLFILGFVFRGHEPLLALLEMPLFIAAMISLFITLPLFRAYKRALIATQQALGLAEEPAAWIELARRRRLAFLAAGLPAWIAAVAQLTGLHPVALFLLALSSVLLLCLYRIPRQLA